MENVDFRNPTSWNAYTYINGDPINDTDPSGLCTAMLAGITMSPNDSSPFDQLQIQLGGVAGFPYSNLSTRASIGNVIAQAFTANTSTQVAFSALLDALVNNSGSIDVIAYSGGAAAFAAAYAELSPGQQARIGNILYISPGAATDLPTTANLNNTSVIAGTGATDVAAMIGTEIPLGVSVTYTNCSHTDLQCLLQAAQPQIAQFTADGTCSSQDIFTYQNPGSYQPGGTIGGSSGVNPNHPVLSGPGPGEPVAPVREPTPVVTSTIHFGGGGE